MANGAAGQRLRPCAAACALPATTLIVLLAAWLSGCATQRAGAPLNGPADPTRRAALQALPGYALRAQLAASNGSEGFSVQLAWRQTGDAAHAELRAPLGVGGAQLDLAGGQLRYVGSDGRHFEGSEAEDALARSLGFAPPLASLRYWLLAVPDPAGDAANPQAGQQASAQASERADVQGRPLQLVQSGWQVDYGDYQFAQGQWLPGRITLLRAPLRLKLRVLHWELP